MAGANTKAGTQAQLTEPMAKVLITEPVEHDKVYMPPGTTYVGRQSVCDHLVEIGVAQAVVEAPPPPPPPPPPPAS